MTPQLTAEEFRVLRKLPVVDSLFRKGLIGVERGHIVPTPGGKSILQEHKAHISRVRREAGRAGGPARAESLTPKRRKQIARAGYAAADLPRKKGGSQ